MPKLKWLGWAGFELDVDGATLVIDPLEDETAVFAPLGSEVTVKLPQIVPASAGRAVAGLVTHLHRDHADAGALAAALAPGAPVLEPPSSGGDRFENLSLAQAEQELGGSGLERRRLEPWESAELGPFRVTALPAVDGIGDPQVAWLADAGGVRVLHLGDTIFHGFWWRMARRHGPFDAVLLPVNGAVLDFPHRQPPSPLGGALGPDEAAIAAQILGARLAIPMHAEGYEVEDVYVPVAGPTRRFEAAASDHGVTVRILEPGEQVDLTSALQ